MLRFDDYWQDNTLEKVTSEVMTHLSNVYHTTLANTPVGGSAMLNDNICVRFDKTFVAVLQFNRINPRIALCDISRQGEDICLITDAHAVRCFLYEANAHLLSTESDQLDMTEEQLSLMTNKAASAALHAITRRALITDDGYAAASSITIASLLSAANGQVDSITAALIQFMSTTYRSRLDDRNGDSSRSAVALAQLGDKERQCGEQEAAAICRLMADMLSKGDMTVTHDGFIAIATTVYSMLAKLDVVLEDSKPFTPTTETAKD